MLEGEVKFVNRDRGYAFIRGDSRDSGLKTDYFFPANENVELYKTVNIGDSVTFNVAVDHQGRYKAIDIKLKGESQINE